MIKISKYFLCHKCGWFDGCDCDCNLFSADEEDDREEIEKRPERIEEIKIENNIEFPLKGITMNKDLLEQKKINTN